MAYNISKGNPFPGPSSPPDGYFLSWNAIDGYWEARTGPSGSFSAGGDLNGSSSSQTVIALRSKLLNSSLSSLAAPQDNYVLTWLNSDGYWAARPTIQSYSDATNSTKGIIKLNNDLGGTADNPLVTGLQSYDVNNIVPSDGYILTWLNSDGYWAPRPAPSGSFSANGDLSGNSSSQNVIKIRGNLVASQILGASQDGYGLIWDNADGYWRAYPIPAGFTAGTDLSGTSTSQTVIKINGATVPIAGSLTSGNILQVNGSSSLAYAAINLAGGSNYVTGLLPSTNQSAQTMGGDVSGTTTTATVIKINGTAVLASPTSGNILVATTSTNSIWSFIYDGYVAASANIAGSKIAGATTGTVGVVRLSNDLGGTSTSPSVLKINGNAVTSQSLSATQDGYVLTWSNTDGYWKASQSVGGGSFTAGGDLTGTSSSQTVAKIKGNSVATQTLGSPEDGYVLTWSNADGYWNASKISSISATEKQVNWSLVDRSADLPLTLTSNTGSFTTGVKFQVQNLLTIKGVRFRYNSTGSKTIKVSLWDSSGTRLASGTISVTTGTAIYSALFDTPYTVTTSTQEKTLTASIWQNDGSNYNYTTADSSQPVLPFMAGPYLTYQNFSNYQAGDAFPNTTAGVEKYNYIEPIFNEVLLTTPTASGDLSGAYPNPNVIAITGSGGTTNIATTGAIFNWATTTSSPTIKQADNTTASATGQVLTIQSQNATGTTATGGKLLLKSGTGTSTPGNIEFSTGSTVIATAGTSKFITNQGKRINTTSTTANLTIVDGYEVILVGTLTGSITITLPASPTTGDIYTIKDQGGSASSFNINISGNGKNIEQIAGGTAATLTLNTNYYVARLIYNGTTWSLI
jgi:hypothetical protein